MKLPLIEALDLRKPQFQFIEGGTLAYVVGLGWIEGAIDWDFEPEPEWNFPKAPECSW